MEHPKKQIIPSQTNRQKIERNPNISTTNEHPRRMQNVHKTKRGSQHKPPNWSKFGFKSIELNSLKQLNYLIYLSYICNVQNIKISR